MRAQAIAALAVGLALCGSADAAPSAAKTAAAGMFRAYLAAWNRGDAHAIAAQFAADGDLINPNGVYARGPAQVEAFYRAAFSRGYAGSKGGFAVKAVRQLGRGVVAVDGVWSIEGAHDARGGVRPPERGLAVGVLVRDRQGWRVALLREQASAEDVEIPPHP